MWSLFMHILPYSNQIRTENAVKTLKYLFSYTEFLSTFERHNVIAVRNVFTNKSDGKMTSLVRSPLCI